MQRYVLDQMKQLLLLSDLQHLSGEDIALAVAGAALTLPFVCFVVKTVAIWLLRKLGLAAPWTYSRFVIPSLPWRGLILRPVMVFGRWKEHVFKIGKTASGGFASIPATLTNGYTNPKSQIPLGLPWIWGFSTYQTIGLDITTHLLCIGQSGGGKSVWLKTLLAVWRNSFFLVDPKGEMTRDILGRKTSHRVVILAPYNQSISGQVNPFCCLHMAFLVGGDDAAIKWAYRIAQSFIETPPNSKQPFFTDTSREYLAGLILFVYDVYPEDFRHLGTVRDLITYGMQVFNDDGSENTTREEAIALLHKMMMESTAFGGNAIAGAAGPFITAGKETLGNLRSTLQGRTKVLDLPGVRYMLSSTTCPIRELKTHDDYGLVINAGITSIRQELQDVVRLITNMVFYTFEDEPVKNGQCLMVQEEFTAQGYNSCVEVALPYARGLGLNFVGLIQDVEALKSAYPTTHLSFIGNSDATIWLSTAHPDNLRLLSSTLGKTVTVRKDKHSGKKNRVETDVATPDQLARFLTTDLGNMIVTRAGKRGLRLRLDPHYKALPVSMYEADPDHKEALLRRIMRFLLHPFMRKPKTVLAHASISKPIEQTEPDMRDASAVQAGKIVSYSNVVSLQEYRDEQ